MLFTGVTGVFSHTSLIQVLDGPEDGVRQLGGDVNEGQHGHGGRHRMPNLGSKLVQNVPHWNQLERGEQTFNKEFHKMYFSSHNIGEKN